MFTTFTNHKALFSLREISPRSKRMRCFHYVCMLLSLILSLGNVRWRVLLMCFATIALMFLSTECVASSISRWLGCKAEYYLLSCSTHSISCLQLSRITNRSLAWRKFLQDPNWCDAFNMYVCHWVRYCSWEYDSSTYIQVFMSMHTIVNIHTSIYAWLFMCEYVCMCLTL